MKFTPGTLSWKRICLHSLSWGLFIGYELWLLAYSGQRFGSALTYILQYSINIALFYAFTTVPGSFFGKRYLYPAARLAVILAAFLCAKLLADTVLAPERTLSARFNYARRFLVPDMIRGLYFILLSVFYWLGGNILRFRERTAIADRLLRDSKIAFLQQQLNPHLLFNSLSFVYSSVSPYSAEGARAVELLSELTRYSLDGAGPDGKALLSEEIAQVQNLVAINRLRYQGDLRLELCISGEPRELRVISLVLLTLSENMFKHGWLTDAGRPALLRLDISDDGKLELYTRNPVSSTAAGQRPSGLGLDTTRTRLNYHYPDAYELYTNQRDGIFELNLKLQL